MKKVKKNKNKLLLASLKKGDRVAFRSIFDLYERKLYCYIFSITKSDYATEEILQEIFIKIWEQRETINLSYSFSSFIYSIARNHTYNYLRNVSRQESLKQELWRNITYFNNITENTILSNEYGVILQDILNDLPKKKKRIYILSKIEGKSNQEISDMLGVTQKTVKNHLWKTLQIIRMQLHPYLETITTLLLLISST